MFFELAIGKILQATIGKYLDGFTRSNFNLALLGGNVRLNDLAIKPEALKAFNLPLKIRGGYVGLLSIKIPWHNLSDQPIILTLQHIHLIVGPKTEFEEEEELSRERTRQNKKDEVRALKIGEKTQSTNNETDEPSFVSSLVTKIVENIQINIEDVHIRYEHGYSDLSVGITIQQATVGEVKQSLEEKTTVTDSALLTKQASLRNASVYVNIGDSALSFGSKAEMKEKMTRLVARGGQPLPGHHYILNPSTLSCKFVVRRNVNIVNQLVDHIAKFAVQLRIQEVALTLEREQLRQILDVVDYMTAFKRQLEHRKMRPTVRPNVDPRSWWRYAYRVIVSPMAQKRTIMKSFLLQTLLQRHEYVILYQAKKRKQMTEGQRRRIREMEDILNPEQISLFRHHTIEDMKARNISIAESRKKKGWMDWMTKKVGLSSEEKEEIMSVIGPQRGPEQQSIQVQQWKLDIQLDKGSITLKTQNVAREERGLGQLNFESLRVGISMINDKKESKDKTKDGSLSVTAALQYFTIEDTQTEDTQYPQLVKPFANSPGDDFLSVQFMTNPIKYPGVDFSISARSKPFRIIPNISWINQIVDFFVIAMPLVSTSSAQQIKYLQEMYVNQMMEGTLDVQSCIHLDIDLAAPQVILPKEFHNKDSLILVAELGRMKMNTPNYSEQKQSSSLSFDIGLTNLSLSIAQMNTWPNTIDFNIIHDFDLNIFLGINRMIWGTKISLSGKLPELMISISPKAIKNLIEIFGTLANKNETVKEDTMIIRSDKSEEVENTQEEKKPESKEKKTLIVVGSFTLNTFKVVMQTDVEDMREEVRHQELIQVELNDFTMNLHHGQKGTRVEAVLQRLFVEDCMNKTGGPKYLIMPDLTNDSTVPSLSARYAKLSSNKSVESILMVQIGRVIFNFDRETVIRVIQWGSSIALSQGEVKPSDSEDRSMSEEDASSDHHGLTRDGEHNEDQVTLKLGFSLHSLQCNLKTRTKTLAEIQLGESQVTMNVSQGRTSISGSLGKLQVYDPNGRKEHSIILSITSDHTIELRAILYNGMEAIKRGISAEINAKLNSVRITYIDKFALNLQKYFTEISEIREMIESTAHKATDAVSDFIINTQNPSSKSAVKMQFLLLNPQVLIPTVNQSSSVNTDTLMVDFGQILVQNSILTYESTDLPFEQVSIQVTRMHMQILNRYGQPIKTLNSSSRLNLSTSRRDSWNRSANEEYTEETHKLMDELDFKIVVERSLDPANEYPALKISITITNVNIRFTREQYVFLISLYNQSFLNQSGEDKPEVEVIPKEKEEEAKGKKGKPMPITASIGGMWRKSYDSKSTAVPFTQILVSVGTFNIHLLNEEEMKAIVIPGSTKINDLSRDTELSKCRLKILLRSQNLEKNLLTKSYPFVVISRMSGKVKVEMIRTEMDDSGRGQWDPIELPITDIMHNERMVFDCYNASNLLTAPSLIGSFTTGMLELISEIVDPNAPPDVKVENKPFYIVNPKWLSKRRRSYENSGTLIISDIELTQSNEFVLNKLKRRALKVSDVIQSIDIDPPNDLHGSMRLGSPVSSIPNSPSLLDQSKHRNTVIKSWATLQLSKLNFHMISNASDDQPSMMIDLSLDLVELINEDPAFKIETICSVKDSAFQMHKGRHQRLMIRLGDLSASLIPELIIPVKDFIMAGLSKFGEPNNLRRMSSSLDMKSTPSSPRTDLSPQSSTVQSHTPNRDRSGAFRVTPQTSQSKIETPQTSTAKIETTQTRMYTPLTSMSGPTQDSTSVQSVGPEVKEDTNDIQYLTIEIQKINASIDPSMGEDPYKDMIVEGAMTLNQNRSQGGKMSSMDLFIQRLGVAKTIGEKMYAMYPTDIVLRTENDSTGSQPKSSLSVSVLEPLRFVLSNSDNQVLSSFQSSLSTQLRISRERETPVLIVTEIEEENQESQELTVRTKGISLCLVHDSVAIPPLLLLNIDPIIVKGQLGCGVVSASIKMDGTFYNISKAIWEPFLEPWLFEFTYTSLGQETLLSLNASTILNINYTHSLIHNITLWSRDTQSVSHDRNASRFQGIHLKNMTNHILSYQISNEGEIFEVKPEEQVAVESRSTSQREVDVLNTQSLSLYINDDRFDGLPMSFEMFKLLRTKDGSTYVYTVRVLNGMRVLSIRSTISLRNTTKTRIEVQLRVVEERRQTVEDSKELFEIGAIMENDYTETWCTLQPDEEISIRPSLVNKTVLSIRPMIEDNVYSLSPPIECATLKPEKKYVSVGKMRTTQQETDDQLWFCINVTRGFTEDIPVYVIEICIPLVLENALPCPLEFLINVRYGAALQSAEQLAVHSVTLDHTLNLQIRIPGYEWSDQVIIQRNSRKETERCFVLKDSIGRPLYLYYEQIWTPNHSFAITVYSKFWIINYTEFNMTLYNSKDNIASGQSIGQLPSTSVSASGERLRNISDYDPTWYDKEDIQSREPLVYSYGQPAFSYTKIQIENSKASAPVSFEIPQEGEVILKERKMMKKEERAHLERKVFTLGVKVELGTSTFRRTKMVTIAPRYIFVNKAPRKIYFQQVVHPKRFKIESNQVIPFHWPNQEGIHEISVSLDRGEKWSWSGGLPLAVMGDTYIRLCRRILDVTSPLSPIPSFDTPSLATPSIHSMSHEKEVVTEYFMRVQMKQNEKGSILVIFKPKTTEFFPYRIENTLSSNVYFHQIDCEGMTHCISPGGTLNYTWDYPGKPHIVFMSMEGGMKRKMYLDKIKQYSNPDFVTTIEAKGPERMVKIQTASELKLSRNLSDMGDRASRTSISSSDDRTSGSVVLINLSAIGISVSDDQPQELMYIYLQSISAKFSSSPLVTEVYASIKSFQIDNQHVKSLLPVFIKPFNLPPDVPAFILGISKSNQYTTLSYYDIIELHLQEMNVSMDNTFINRILSFFNTNLGAMNDDHYVSSTVGGVLEGSLNTDDSNQLIYIKRLYLKSVRANITFYTLEDDDDQSPLRMMLGSAVSTLPNIESAPLRMAELCLSHPFLLQRQLIDTVTKHYISQVIRGSYKVLGSAEFLGNPVSIVNSLGTGIKDFFYEPIAGAAHGASEFGRGLGKGSKSLAKKSVYGLFSGGSKLTANLTSGLTKLTMDNKYSAQRKEENLVKPHNVTEGLKEGAKHLGKGFFEGFSGILTQPISGFRDGGVKGLAKGIGRGLVGVPIKPVNGIVDMATKTMQGVYNSVTEHEYYRIRPPRSFTGNVLTNYSMQSSLLQFIMGNYLSDKFPTDKPISAFLCTKVLYILTDKHIISVHEKQGRQFSIHWKLSYYYIKSVSRVEGTQDISISVGKPNEPPHKEKILHAIESNVESLLSSIDGQRNKFKALGKDYDRKAYVSGSYIKKTISPLTQLNRSSTTTSFADSDTGSLYSETRNSIQ
ncbi:vacuolar associated sorting protein [Planoprotostelium fungivorum]|uniref:Vacuolar associated sorting protein n=1 Tax=Planoprotostelium fungivorum TaxID=1890364 RepID=A0A2P6NED2_9EUKA|nr:vacuolar associated sorting protein [Planoprotostelium fungivorum]